jgi:hypothetical protein
MGKTWHFIFTKIIFFLQQGHKKQKQKKLLSFKSNKNKTKKVNTDGLSPVKRFLYSHIAKLHTFFFQDQQVS